jgi:hypothetical protein
MEKETLAFDVDDDESNFVSCSSTVMAVVSGEGPEMNWAMYLN